jgi:delta1-piperideine-2-carboxylate reductase
MAKLSLDEIYDLGCKCLTANGADDENAKPLARTMAAAERDGSAAHGLFRLPAYIASLRSGKVCGTARPRVTPAAAGVIHLDGDGGYAPLAHEVGIPPLIDAARQSGIAALAIRNTHHMAALWPEVEKIAAQDLAAMACTAYMPSVAPAGASAALFGTNPLAFAWPRPGGDPAVFDMATAAMAMGEVQIAAREGRPVPPGTGLDKDGAATTDPAQIAAGGVLLPFGGYKGSAIALMVELLAAGLVGENFSYEAKQSDNRDGGPPRGGEFILAMSPQIFGGKEWAAHCEQFFQRFAALPGARLPGTRRFQNRRDNAPRLINDDLLKKIQSLM